MARYLYGTVERSVELKIRLKFTQRGNRYINFLMNVRIIFSQVGYVHCLPVLSFVLSTN
jgi:hypothetical protein